MCYLCKKDDIFANRQPTTQERLRERAAEVKDLLTEIDRRVDKVCWVGRTVIDLLKEEQYELEYY